MSDFNYIKNTPVVETIVEEEVRFGGVSYLPSSIDPKDFAPVQVDEEENIVSFNLPSGSGITLSLTVTNELHNSIIVYIDYSIFVGSTSDPVANLLPGGSSLNLAQWTLIGPIDLPYSGASPTEDYQHGSRIYIAQTTGSTQSMTVVKRTRRIVNQASS